MEKRYVVFENGGRYADIDFGKANTIEEATNLIEEEYEKHCKPYDIYPLGFFIWDTVTKEIVKRMYELYW